VLLDISEKEYDVVMEALLLYSRIHHKEFREQGAGESRDVWLASWDLIQKIEMQEGLST
jgi:hypothetical protein